MTPTRWRSLAGVALAAGVLGYVFLQVMEASGRYAATLPWTAVAAMVVLAVAVLVIGWPVRRWNRGHRDRHLDPIRAARTAVLAKAASLAGSALAGWYAGQVLRLLPDVAITPRRDVLLSDAAAVGTALLLLAAGLVVERWCRLPGGDDDEDDTPQAPPEEHGYSHDRRDGRG